MDKGTLAARRQLAVEKLSASAAELASRFVVEPPNMAAPAGGSPEIRQMYMLEGLAVFMADLANASLSAAPEAGFTAALTIAQLEERAGGVDDAAVIRAMLADENAGKQRKTAVAFLEERLAGLEAESNGKATEAEATAKDEAGAPAEPPAANAGEAGPLEPLSLVELEPGDASLVEP